MKKIKGPVGLLDSGVGGLTVLKEVFNFLPDEDVVYYGDTLHLPYGPRPLWEVRNYVFNIIDYLIDEKGIKAIVIACNTATSAALTQVKSFYSIPAFGTVEGAVRKTLKVTRNKKVGVIGTEGTINSKAYQDLLLKLDPEIRVYSQACPVFVDLVEDGKFSGSEVEEVIAESLGELKKAGIDALILGCTHYPYLIQPLREYMGEGVNLISSGVEMAKELSRSLKDRELLNNKREKHEFIVSDISRISQSFLEKGREFLRLPSLNFKEQNIFKQREEASG